MENYDKTAQYNDKIKPLVHTLFEAAKAENIPIIIACATKHSDAGTRVDGSYGMPKDLTPSEFQFARKMLINGKVDVVLDIIAFAIATGVVSLNEMEASKQGVLNGIRNHLADMPDELKKDESAQV